MQDEKIKDMKSYAHVVENGEVNINAYADGVKITEHVKTNVGTAEQSERVKCSMNVMLRGLPEPKKEAIMTLNARMSKFFDEHFGMQDVILYARCDPVWSTSGREKETRRRTSRGMHSIGCP